MRIRTIGLLLALFGGADTQAQIVTTPCQSVGGVCVGAEGAPNTIYAGHILSWGDDFTSALDIVGPQAPKGKFFPTKGYSSGARGGFSFLGTTYDTDPLNTGYLDSNRGVAVGFDNLTQSGGILTLRARNSTSGEQANIPFTSQIYNSGVRAQISSGIHSEGVVGFYPSTTGSVIVEARIKYTGNSSQGWHPDFWVNSGNPMNTFGAGNFDSINACEGNSFTCTPSDLHIVNGVTSSAASGASYTNLFDGNFHILGFELQNGGTQTIVDLDGVNHNLFATDSNFAGKPQYLLITSHIYTAFWLSENYNPATWNSTGANIQVDWVRVWRPDNGTAKHIVPLRNIPDLLVDYSGVGSIVLPSALQLWGDAGVTEYVQSVDTEPNEPGMGFNTIYDQFPAGVTYNSGTRTISVDFSAQTGSAGVLHMIAKAWKPDGSTFQPARFTIYRGPRQNTRGGNITIGSASSVDIYASCDVGIATTNPPSVKITSVSGLPSGMTYSSSTGLATGTPSAGSTASVTCVNNVAQSLTYNLVLGTLQNETYALEQRMNTLPTTTTENAINAAIVSLKTNGLWNNISVFQWFGLGDSQASLLNWKGDYWNGTLTGTPTFSAYNGFTTNGTSNLINTGFSPSIYDSINAVAVSVQSNTAGTGASSGVGYFLTATGLTMNLRNASDQFVYRANDGTAATIANTDGSGFFTVMRSGSTVKKAFRNGAQIGTTLSTASTTFTAGNVCIGSLCDGASFAARQWEGSIIRFGSFADADEANLASVVSALKAGVGP